MRNSLQDYSSAVHDSVSRTRHPIVEADLNRIVLESHGFQWSKMEGKTVLVTGANGMLPAYMVESILRFNEVECRKRIKVIALVRNVEKASARFAAYRGRRDLSFIEQDVSEPITVDGHIAFIIHAASQASPKYFGNDPVGTLLPNVQGTYRLLQLARDHQTEGFLYFSSAEVYGQLGHDHMATNEQSYGHLDPTALRSCYAESKRMGETMCVCWHHQYGVPTKIIRPFHTYGPGMQVSDGRVFADFVADIVANRNIHLKSAGIAERSFCYLADATSAFFTVMLEGKAGQAYNVGNDNEIVSIRELADTLVSLFPEKQLKVVTETSSPPTGYIQSEVSRHCPDISKIRALGWEPTTSIEDGFRKTVRSFE